MSGITTCVATSAAWCFCTASASLLSSCCGNDKPSTVAPGPNSGRKRSVLLLLVSIALSIAFQWGLARLVIDKAPSQLFLRDYWLEDCEKEYINEIVGDDKFLQSCVGNQANYRVAFSTTVFFVLAGLAALCKPSANREAWPAKFVLYLFLVVAMIFVPSHPLFSDIFLNIARAGGALFIFFEQIVIIDVSHNWNESWVEKSNAAEAQEPGSGQNWLTSILISCAVLFMAALAMLIYTIVEFSGCTMNNTMIAVTCILIVAVLVAQLSGEEGSLLSSACVAAWASYLCYAAASKNPNVQCNPHSGELSVLSIVLGIGITIMSLLWAGWSYTAEAKLSSSNNGGAKDNKNDAVPSSAKKNNAAPQETVVGGIVTGSTDEEDGTTNKERNDNDDEAKGTSANAKPSGMTWRLNLALAVISCWASMILTHWGEVQANGISANPNIGRISMWMIIASQWLVLSLYLWTLLAPRLFPNRDFS